MNELKSWIITLVTISVLCSIIECFVPKGNMEKYVKLICGLAVTSVIAMPVINFLSGDIKLDSIAWNQYMQLSEGELKGRIEEIEEEDSVKMLELYRISLINDIKARFKGYKEYQVTDVDAVLYENYGDENYARIRCLYITLAPSKDNRIGVLSEEAASYIKNHLMGTFAIKEDQIILNLSKFNGGK